MDITFHRIKHNSAIRYNNMFIIYGYVGSIEEFKNYKYYPERLNVGETCYAVCI